MTGCVPCLGAPIEPDAGNRPTPASALAEDAGCAAAAPAAPAAPSWLAGAPSPRAMGASDSGTTLAWQVTHIISLALFRTSGVLHLRAATQVGSGGNLVPVTTVVFHATLRVPCGPETLEKVTQAPFRTWGSMFPAAPIPATFSQTATQRPYPTARACGAKEHRHLCLHAPGG